MAGDSVQDIRPNWPMPVRFTCCFAKRLPSRAFLPFLCRLIGASLILFSGCIDAIKPELYATDKEPALVVDGMITDKPGPFRIRLTKSGPVELLFNLQPFTGAQVEISDDRGNSWSLNGKGDDGWYETDDKNLQGVPGTTYTLRITDDAGNRYESSPQMMQDVPEIDSVYARVVTRPRFEDGSVYNDNWLNIQTDTHDPSGNTKYWLWRFEETWEVRMLNYVRVDYGSSEHPDCKYDYVTIDPEKVVCWVTRPSGSVVLRSTVTNSEDSIRGLVLQTLGPGTDKLFIRYSIQVKQYALDAASYQYWKQLKTQSENTGGIYSTLPAPVYGNMTCTRGGKEVLGYFSASSVSEKRIFIESGKYPIQSASAYQNCVYLAYPNIKMRAWWIYFANTTKTNQPLWLYDKFCSDCRFYGSNVKPDFW